jgi:hypothetical protein
MASRKDIIIMCRFWFDLLIVSVPLRGYDAGVGGSSAWREARKDERVAK